MKTEGRNAVIELLKTGKNIDKLLLEKGAQGSLGLIFAEARRKNIRVQFVVYASARVSTSGSRPESASDAFIAAYRPCAAASS